MRLVGARACGFTEPCLVGRVARHASCAARAGDAAPAARVPDGHYEGLRFRGDAGSAPCVQEMLRRRRAFLTAMAELLRRRRAIQAGLQVLPPTSTLTVCAGSPRDRVTRTACGCTRPRMLNSLCRVT